MGIRLPVKLLWTMLVILAILVLTLLILLTASRIANLLPHGGADGSRNGDSFVPESQDREALRKEWPEGTKIAFVGSEGENNSLYTLDLHTGETAKLTSDVSSYSEPDPAPDGLRIAFSDQKDDIYVIDLDGTNRRLLHGDIEALDGAWSMDLDPSWSPDGGKVAFASSVASKEPGIYVMASDGTNVIRITGTPGEAHHAPEWSDDGRRIVFDKVFGGPPQSGKLGGDRANGAFAVNLDGTGMKRLSSALDAGNQLSASAYSPNVEKLAFVSDRGGARDLYTVRTDGSDLRRVTHDQANEYSVSWSQDGSRLLYAADSDLYVIEADGTDLRRLTNTPNVQDGLPVWIP